MGLSSREVCRVLGVSYRQLDYWDRTGFASPSIGPAMGSGSKRRWSAEDVRQVFVVKQLYMAHGPN